MSAVFHLSLHDVLAIRDAVAAAADVADREWRFELINPNGLITALTTPFQGAFGVAAFPSVPDKAAALTFLLIANHPFRDGNKRIAGAALRLFLERNGYRLQASAAELEAFTVQVLHASLRDEQVLAWLAGRIGAD